MVESNMRDNDPSLQVTFDYDPEALIWLEVTKLRYKIWSQQILYIGRTLHTGGYVGDRRIMPMCVFVLLMW